MADYFEEMSWRPLGDVEPADGLIHLARSLYELISASEDMPTQWPSLPPPASAAVIEQLKRETGSNDGQTCSICLKLHKREETLVRMPCNHVYHCLCILTWLNKTNSCPMCRFELPTDNPQYEEYKRQQLRAKEREEELKVLHNSMFM